MAKEEEVFKMIDLILPVLSYQEPYGTLVAVGIKPVENRKWFRKYRGPILIHTSKTWYPYIQNNNPLTLFNRKQLEALEQYPELMEKIRKKELPTSAIIGQSTLTGIIMNSPSIWAMNGQFHWLMADAKYFDEPILNVKGQLGLWQYNLTTKGVVSGGKNSY